MAEQEIKILAMLLGAPRFRLKTVAARARTPSNVVGPHTSGSGRAVVLGSLAPLRCSAGKLFHSSGALRSCQKSLRRPMTMHCGCVCQGCWTCPLMRVREVRRTRLLLPLASGGMGLRNAVLAYWASWGNALSMISQRHRAVATTIVREMSGHSTSTHLNAVARSADQPRRFRGFEVPSWTDSGGLRPFPTNIKG